MAQRNEKGQFVKGFKPEQEWLDKIILAHKGKKRPPFNEEWRAKIGAAQKGNTHRRGKKMPPMTEETRIKNRNSHLGSKNGNWKGGSNRPLAKLIRESYKYRMWRSAIFERDNWTCQTCNERGCRLEAHHIKRFARILKDSNITSVEQSLACDELWMIDNGVTLCLGCHNLTKTGRKK